MSAGIEKFAVVVMVVTLTFVINADEKLLSDCWLSSAVLQSLSLILCVGLTDLFCQARATQCSRSQQDCLILAVDGYLLSLIRFH